VANHKSAEKRARQTIKKTANNKTKSSAVKSAIKNVRAAIEAKDKTAAKGLMLKAQSLIDKLAKSGFIKREAAARKNSRLSAQVAKL